METLIHCKYDELVNPKSLKNHPKNRNKHGQDQIDRLAELYKYHGIRHPIIVSKQTNCIVAGHGRKLAALRAGIKQVPVVYQDFQSSEAEYAFIQADNAIATWAELDLSAINTDLADLGPDFDIDMLGIKDFSLEVGEAELPDLDSEDPDCQQVSFILSNEQKDTLDECLKKARNELDCTDQINQNKNGNALSAILRLYVGS
jgi:hypothetical protein